MLTLICNLRSNHFIRMLNFLSKNKVIKKHRADKFVMSTKKEQSDGWADDFVFAFVNNGLLGTSSKKMNQIP